MIYQQKVRLKIAKSYVNLRGIDINYITNEASMTYL